MEPKLFLLIICVGSVLFVSPCTCACNYTAIFSFGDSLTDTGNAIRTSPIFFNSAFLPYGETYFHHGALRYSDGRLIIDFLAQSVGLAFLNPYLAYRRAGTDFSSGVNYAVAGGTVQGAGSILFTGGINFLTVDNLQVQLGWHLRIKGLADSGVVSPDLKLPSPESFSQGLYFIAIGGNDYGSTFLRQTASSRLSGSPSSPLTNTKELELIPLVVGNLTAAIETLYENEARNFFILNIGPEGCAPFYLKLLNGSMDELGCLEAINQVDEAHNQLLTESLVALKQKYSDINFLFGDYNSAYKLVRTNPSAYGFQEAVTACCGAGPTIRYGFELSKICMTGRYVCPDPSVYIQWDGIHQTDAFSRLIVNQFVSGSSLSPPNGLSCATLV